MIRVQALFFVYILVVNVRRTLPAVLCQAYLEGPKVIKNNWRCKLPVGIRRQPSSVAMAFGEIVTESLGNQKGQLFAVGRWQFLDFCLFVSLVQSVTIVVFY